MSTVTSNLVLTSLGIDENSGRLCYKNIVTVSNVTATSEIAGSPVTNLANPSTDFVWEASSTAQQTLTIAAGGQSIDYIGIARHNLNRTGAEIRIRFDAVTVRDWGGVSDLQAILLVFSEAMPTNIYIDIRNGSEAPVIGVLYCGLSLQLERRIYVGHTPITYGRDRQVIQGVSQSGNYLGEIVLNQSLSNTVDLQNLTPQWYRENLDPFFAQSPRKPCFFAWRPGRYPAEVAYCWVEGNPRPTNQRSNGMMSINWNFRGIA